MFLRSPRAVRMGWHNVFSLTCTYEKGGGHANRLDTSNVNQLEIIHLHENCICHRSGVQNKIK